MRTFVAFVVGSLVVGSVIAVAYAGGGDPGGAQGGGGATSSSNSKGESSPFVVGEWKFVRGQGSSPNATPVVDTEFRFVNPTTLTTTIEYAFFELDGTFCGCDRDDFTPNKTVLYTVLDEALAPTPVPKGNITHLFSCTGTSGALKSIVFKNNGSHIVLDDATQVGFQTHAFGGITEPATTPSSDLLTGTRMTEAGLKGVAITDATLADIRRVHDLCVSVQGPLHP